MMILALRAVAALAAAATLAGCQKCDDEAFGEKVHAYLMAHPEVIREAVMKEAENQQKAALKATTDALGKFRSQLERDPRDLVANPNGAINNIAGIVSENGRVLGMMPHPERLADAKLGGTDGKAMFDGLVEALS